MPFVSSNYKVLGKDVMDWMTWPSNGIAIAIPLALIGNWQPFAWLKLVAFGILFVASAYILVFLAAAAVQVLLNQLDDDTEALRPPVYIRILKRVPAKIWIASSCVPAGLSLPVFAWGVFRFHDPIMVAGTNLFVVPVLATLTLAAIVRTTYKSASTGA
jgi:hypothetical protein